LVIDGDGVAPVVVPAGVTRAEVVFTKAGEIVLNGRVGTRVLGRSAPVLVEGKR
jgi:hypothetical protein